MADEKLLELLARAAGLDVVWRDFRADLVAAAQQVEDQRQALSSAPPPVAEPWPPMRTPPADE